MSDTSEHISAIQADVKHLREEVAGLAGSICAKNRESIEGLGRRLADQLEQYGVPAGEGAKKLVGAGQAGLEELCEHVRNNPVSSLLAAFGAGAVLACLLRK